MYTIKSRKEVLQIVEEIKQVNLSQYIGIKLKEIREQKGLTQIELSRLTIQPDSMTPEVTNSAISYTEKGEQYPNVYTLEQLAKALNVSITYFLPV